MGYVGGEISDQRAQNMDYYLGEPYGNEIEDRSQVITREVADTIEWMMPDILRVFTTSDRAVEFEPVGPEDEEQAKQETDVVNYVFYKENQGFLIFYSWFKDALLSKNGIVKCFWDEAEVETREEYSAKNDDELAFLLQDPELEVVEKEEFIDELTGLMAYNLVCKRTQKKGRVNVLPVPPEEFLISKDANSPYTNSARFVGHRVRKTASDLIEMGYDPDEVDGLPYDDGYAYNDERISRRNLEDETPDSELVTLDRSMRTIWIVECYIRADYDGDGIAELRKITKAGNKMLDNEPVDRIPFHSITPIILTHKFFGLCPADFVKDIQIQKSTVLRNIFDNFYILNNSQKVINDNVNLADLLTSRPGGVVRTQGQGPVQNDIMEMPVKPIGADGYNLMEYLDNIRKDRTGIDENIQGLSPDVLAKTTNGALAASAEAAKQRIALIARVFAETGVKDLFQHIHELLIKHQDKAKVVKLRGKWVEVLPTEWKHRENMTINVGLGTGSREQQMMGAAQLVQEQKEIVATGGMGVLTTPGRMFNAYAKFSESLGYKNADLFFLDPDSEEAQQWAQKRAQDQANQPPPPEMQLLQVEMAKVQQRAQESQDKAQLELQKIAFESQKFQAQLSQQITESMNQMAAKLTELELRYQQNVPGSRV